MQLRSGEKQLLERDGAAVGQARGERLLLHEVGEDTGVGGQAGEGEAQVLVDGDDLLLVGGELFGIALREGGMLASYCCEGSWSLVKIAET